MNSKAIQGKSKQSTVTHAKQSVANKVEQSEQFSARQSKAKQGTAKLCKASTARKRMQSKAKQGRTAKLPSVSAVSAGRSS